MSLLELEGVQKSFWHQGVRVRAVDGVDVHVEAAETVSIIGESGSGKSTLARLALGLIASDGGTIRFAGREWSKLGGRERRSQHSRMTVVFQEPFESLNPRMRVGSIIGEPLAIRRVPSGKAERRRLVDNAMEQVGLGGGFAAKYPSEMSGGQQQRVSLARAIVTQPQLIVLDEPTSSLDLSVQAQVLELLIQLRRSLGVAYLFITHDIEVAEYLSDRIAVMYQGRVVEHGPTRDVLDRPSNDYTKRLLASVLPPLPNDNPQRSVSPNVL